MAGRLNKVFLAFSLPLLAICSLYWLRKRKKPICEGDNTCDLLTRSKRQAETEEDVQDVEYYGEEQLNSADESDMSIASNAGVYDDGEGEFQVFRSRKSRRQSSGSNSVTSNTSSNKQKAPLKQVNGTDRSVKSERRDSKIAKSNGKDNTKQQAIGKVRNSTKKETAQCNGVHKDIKKLEQVAAESKDINNSTSDVNCNVNTTFETTKLDSVKLNGERQDYLKNDVTDEQQVNGVNDSHPTEECKVNGFNQSTEGISNENTEYATKESPEDNNEVSHNVETNINDVNGESVSNGEEANNDNQDYKREENNDENVINLPEGGNDEEERSRSEGNDEAESESTVKSADKVDDQGEMSPNTGDVYSEVSSDSGKGSSDIYHANRNNNANGVAHTYPAGIAHQNHRQLVIYQFEIPQDLCGFLIGKGGHFVSHIKKRTNASVIINRHPQIPYNVKVCSIEGTQTDIQAALQMIRDRLPLSKFPDLTLDQINVINLMPCPLVIPQACHLSLPQGVTCDVIISNILDVDHIFVQQPTHPTFPSLSRLDQFMVEAYENGQAPPVPTVDLGIICAAPRNGGWYRGVVTVLHDKDECTVKFVDYGGYERLPVSTLRQIRVDFMSLPFQATECLLADINAISTDDLECNQSAKKKFAEMVHGQVLQASIVGYDSENNLPFVNIYKVSGESITILNPELISAGLAKWIQPKSSI